MKTESIFFFLFYFSCMYLLILYVRVCMCESRRMCEGQGTTLCCRFSPSPSPSYQTQVVRLSGRCLYPRSPLTGPEDRKQGWGNGTRIHYINNRSGRTEQGLPGCGGGGARLASRCRCRGRKTASKALSTQGGHSAINKELAVSGQMVERILNVPKTQN